MSIPHDYYLKFISNEVLDDTLIYHNKGNFVIHKATQHFSTLHHIPNKELEQLTGNELKLNISQSTSSCQNLSLPVLPVEHHLRRNDSCAKFDNGPLDFCKVQALLAPLLKKENCGYNRGYPSGGALYPVEVFCCNLNNQVNHWPTDSNCLHLLPSSRKFENYSPEINIHELQKSLIPEPFDLGTPSIALIYCIYLPKAIFKYRYRGYRLAHMEAGSMYMLVDLRCKELRLESRLWSGFSDHELAQRLNLNPTLFLPACIQFIG
ncbi:SagB/ThcOx family dehydrogenase [Pseudomonas sp. Teo4]|uniref:SagB/ThcOx family dehydrogenase n=1 Tax=Pseudomonas sp. Teo4 TaxID=3064528 RepID=UPI002ABB3564|nr:SagB/ThcOx family dehydrogenase [Pseudomonas sp. Teo4]MDZ3993786.1 Microcin B17-processing protein McbC [Pseudomonas sp. Teo4]